jgi:large subunit ribosomal protein L30
MDQIKLTQVKSTIGVIPKHRSTMAALGLKKIGNSKLHKNTPEIKGMIRLVNYLLKVEKA